MYGYNLWYVSWVELSDIGGKKPHESRYTRYIATKADSLAGLEQYIRSFSQSILCVEFIFANYIGRVDVNAE